MGLAARDEGKAQAAQLARRCTMRADPALIEELAPLERADAITAVIEAEPDTAQCPVTDDSKEALVWWFGRIQERSQTIQDRMAFLWHSIIPTHRHSVGQHELVAIQLNMIRANALGNFRSLLHEFVTDGAMLRYLDADRSKAKNPNENLPRELMELFTVGIGHYTEDDVRSAALAMSGWVVDEETQEVALDPERANTEPVTFLGETGEWDVHRIVDRLCDHPATAARISSMVWYHLTGKVLDSGSRSELGSWWQGQGLEIKPLVDRVVRSEAFWADHYARPRTGFEYYTALAGVADLDPSEIWRARNLGQVPYEPPNVGGWPIGDRWLGADSVLRRGEQVFGVNYPDKIEGSMEATVDDILDALGLWVISDETRAALDGFADLAEELGDESVAHLRWRVALSAPEFQLQ